MKESMTLACPACKKMIPIKAVEWYRCPHCGTLVRLQIDPKTHEARLQRGHIVAEETPVITPETDSKAEPAVKTYAQTAPPPTLSTVRNERRNITTRLRAIPQELKILREKRGNVEEIKKVQAEIDKLTKEESDLKQKDQELGQLEARLLKEQQAKVESALKNSSSSNSNNNSSNPPGNDVASAFGCAFPVIAAILIGLGIAFKIHWDANVILGILAVSLAGGFIVGIKFSQ
ncbi:MAG: hypothetical protein U0Z26_18650 [Anaerolineales bacterium]